MAGRPAALLAALVSAVMAVGKYFSSKNIYLYIKICNFSTLKWTYVRGIMLDFPNYWALSPSISFKRGLAAWGACETEI